MAKRFDFATLEAVKKRREGGGQGGLGASAGIAGAWGGGSAASKKKRGEGKMSLAEWKRQKVEQELKMAERARLQNAQASAM